MESAVVNIGICESNHAVKNIKLSGRIDTITADKVNPEIMQAVEESQGGLIFNLENVSFVSSAGIRIFLAAYKKGTAANIKVAMVHVNPSVYKIFKVAGLESIFKIYNDEAEALKELWAEK